MNGTLLLEVIGAAAVAKTLVEFIVWLDRPRRAKR